MKAKPNFQLPQNLTPQTAMAIFDLLSDLMDAVWEQYEPGLVEQMIEELHLEPDPQQVFNFDDDLLF